MESSIFFAQTEVVGPERGRDIMEGKRGLTILKIRKTYKNVKPEKNSLVYIYMYTRLYI